MRIHARIKLKMKQKENPDNLPDIYQAIAESICLLDSFSTWSKRNLKIELSCSKKTINKIYNGMDTSLFAYCKVISCLAYSADWRFETSQIPEMLEGALKTNKPLVIGVYDSEKGELEVSRPFMVRDL